MSYYNNLVNKREDKKVFERVKEKVEIFSIVFRYILLNYLHSFLALVIAKVIFLCYNVQSEIIFL